MPPVAVSLAVMAPLSAAELNAQERAKAEDHFREQCPGAKNSLRACEVLGTREDNYEEAVGDGGVAYQKLMGFTLKCKGCGTTLTKVSAGKKWNAAKRMKHFFSCDKLEETHGLEVEGVAAESNSSAAKDWLARRRGKKRAASDATVDQEAAKHSAKKAARPAKARLADAEAKLEKVSAFGKPIPDWMCAAIFHVMCLFFFACNVPFSVVDHWAFKKFVHAVNGSFYKYLCAKGTEGRKAVRNKLPEIYEETQRLSEEFLNENYGLRTLGIDGHKDTNKRHVTTISTSKPGASIFNRCVWVKTKGQGGDAYAEVVEEVIGDKKDEYIAVVSDNASNMLKMQVVLSKIFPFLIMLGCLVHIMDLLVEDIASLTEVAAIADDMRFLAVFVKGNGMLYEWFIAHKQGPMLVIYPATRFAYVYLMAHKVLKNIRALEDLKESSEYANAKRAGGKRSNADFEKFERLVAAEGVASLKSRAQGLHDLLVDLSMTLTFLSGDSAVASYGYPLFEAVYTGTTSLPPSVSKVFTSAMLVTVKALIKDRWESKWAQKVGAKSEALQAAFIFNPYVCALCPQLGKLKSVKDAAKSIIAKRGGLSSTPVALIEQEFDSYRQALVDDTPRNTVYQDEVEGAAKTARQAMRSAMAKLREEGDETPSPARVLIATLELLPSPVEWWYNVKSVDADGAALYETASKNAFCTLAAEVSSIIPHSIGPERHGKGYKLVVTKLRTRLTEVVVMMLIYVYFNARAAYRSTPGSFLGGGAPVSSLIEMAGDCIEEDEVDSLSFMLLEGDEGTEEDERDEGDGEDNLNPNGETASVEEEDAMFWIPKGYEILKEAPEINATLEKSYIMYKFDAYGWAMGRVKTYHRPTSTCGKKGFTVQVYYHRDNTVYDHALSTSAYADTESLKADEVDFEAAGSWVACKKLKQK